MKKWPVVGGVLTVLWLFVTGVSFSGAPREILDAFVGAVLVGVVVAFPIAYATRDIYTDQTNVARTLSVVPSALLYVVLFLRELLTANFDVAYRVLSPSLPIDPDVVAVPLRVEGDIAITTIANSITLTPGTLTMDYDEATNTLYVHAITGKSNYESVVDPIRAWEDLALVIFDEQRSPDDAPPADPGGDASGQ
ncbi:Na+/H+ antiporter subunit E [Halomarina oriensis]|uniref:Cation transporter n=1 Tax=Halomarina oriensis TaxID=671145 RepID=A0A6B0GKL8_9EURY|nr:Na+/H+ antiporter subunit E [Halomarina oriensis]MWG33333.1 cation transporter [Halomarina oriensis]